MMISKLKWAATLALAILALGLGAMAVARQDPTAKPSAKPAQGGANHRPAAADDLAQVAPGKVAREAELKLDNMILSYMPDWAFGNVDNIGVANNDNGVRTLLEWPDVPESEAGSPDLRFFVALYSRKTDEGRRPGPILAFEVTAPWLERTSWTTQPPYDPEPVSSTAFQPGLGWKLFEVTSMVRKNKGRAENGILLRFLGEGHQGVGAWSGYQFVSREGAGEWAGRHPRLIVVESPKK